jgi:hypothetical protein
MLTKQTMSWDEVVDLYAKHRTASREEDCKRAVLLKEIRDGALWTQRKRYAGESVYQNYAKMEWG